MTARLFLQTDTGWSLYNGDFMNAIHILWTKPFFANGGTDFEMADFDILTAALSALKWREKNGRIKMVVDTVGYEYLRREGLLCLWDEAEVSLDGITVDPRMFWAAGKLYALRGQKAPCVMLDTDFIVWREVAFSTIKQDIAVIHTERLYPDVYPDADSFKMKDGYKFDDAFDWSVCACNTAFLYIGDDAFLKYYTDTAIDFMQSASGGGDTLTYMVFAEQRLLPMCACKYGKSILALSNLERLFKNGEGYFTHTWGFKQQMRDNPSVREDFCRRCVRRLRADFPEYAQMLSRTKSLKKYFE